MMRAGFLKLEFLIILALLGVMVLVLMLPSNPLDRLPGQDNGVFLYGGQQVLLGRIPYHDFWDHKGPLIYYLNALGLLLASGSRWGVWLMEYAFLFLTAAGLYRLTLHKWGFSIAWLTAGLWLAAIYAVGPYHHFRDSNYTETYALFFNVWSILLWVHAADSSKPVKYYLMIGFLTGLSLALRPNNIATQSGIALAELITGLQQNQFKVHLKNIFLVLAGIMLILVAFAVWFWIRGGLAEMVDAVFFYNIAYGRKNLSSHTAFSVISYGASQLLWIPIIAYFLLLIFLIRSSKVDKKDISLKGNMFLLFLIISWPLEILFAVLSGRALLHYYILWTPYAGLLPAAVLAMYGKPVGHFLDKNLHDVLLGGCLILIIAASLINGKEIRRLTVTLVGPHRQVEATNALVNYVTENTKPEAEVLVWGNDVWINFLSDRRSPTRYSYQYPLFLQGYTNLALVEQFLAELRSLPPELILEPVVDTDEISPLNPARRNALGHEEVFPDGMDAVFAFVQDNYCLTRTIGDVIVYKRLASSLQKDQCP